MPPSDAMKVNHRTRRTAEDTKSYRVDNWRANIDQTCSLLRLLPMLRIKGLKISSWWDLRAPIDQQLLRDFHCFHLLNRNDDCSLGSWLTTVYQKHGIKCFLSSLLISRSINPSFTCKLSQGVLFNSIYCLQE